MNGRPIIAAVFAFWLAFGPAVSAWAQSADMPCESMSMPMPGSDGCCDEGMDAAKCLSACLTAAPALAAPMTRSAPQELAVLTAPSVLIRHSSVLAPPDIAPPKSFVS